jgi:hypothetical protein
VYNEDLNFGIKGVESHYVPMPILHSPYILRLIYVKTCYASLYRSEVILGWDNPAAPAAPAPIQSLLFSSQILTGITLILVLHNTSSDSDALLRFLLDSTTYPNDFLSEVPRLFFITTVTSFQ